MIGWARVEFASGSRATVRQASVEPVAQGDTEPVVTEVDALRDEVERLRAEIVRLRSVVGICSRCQEVDRG